VAEKVFAMCAYEVMAFNDFIQGKCVIRDILIDELYD